MTAAQATHDAKAEIGIKILTEKSEPGYRLTLVLANNQLECRASIDVLDVEATPAPSDLIELLEHFDIKERVNLEQIAVFCTEAAQGSSQQNVLLAEGIPPTAGEDGRFELEVKDSTADVEYEQDRTGKIDFRTLHTFTNVEPGQRIGTIYPPIEGDTGLTVQSQKIPALLGEPLKLKAGDGVVFQDNVAIAERGGRVVYTDNSLAIADEFVVSGDVDLSVGNIDFNGFVEIKGDVLNDFHIKSTKGIRVTGAVGACRLESGGPVEIGSMAGMGVGLIRCQGDLQARYLNHVTVECWGDVNVSHEIRNSVVKSTGAILCESGTISGGETVALDGIAAKHLGSISGVKTKLIAGIYFPESDRLNFLKTRVKSLTLQNKRITEAIGPLGKRQTNLRKALQEAIELRLSILTQRKEALEAEKEQLSAELASFEVHEHPTANPKINAGNSLKEGVTLSLGESNEEVTYERSGPISIIENSANGGFRYLTMSPLKVTAAQIEEEAIEEERAAADEGSESEQETG